MVLHQKVTVVSAFTETRLMLTLHTSPLKPVFVSGQKPNLELEKTKPINFGEFHISPVSRLKKRFITREKQILKKKGLREKRGLTQIPTQQLDAETDVQSSDLSINSNPDEYPIYEVSEPNSPLVIWKSLEGSIEEGEPKEIPLELEIPSRKKHITTVPNLWKNSLDVQRAKEAEESFIATLVSTQKNFFKLK